MAGALRDPSLHIESWVLSMGAGQCLQGSVMAQGLSQTQPRLVWRQGTDGSRREGAGRDRFSGLGMAGVCVSADGLSQVREGTSAEDSGRAGTWLPCVLSSSLVSTNEHLLQELGQVRAQHRAEVEQLHWSYKELKKTMALFPLTSTRPGGSS